jgi:hypothetical protein
MTRSTLMRLAGTASRSRAERYVRRPRTDRHGATAPWRDHIRQRCARCPLLAASQPSSSKSTVRTASGGQKLSVDVGSLHDTPCPPHAGCGGFGMLAICEGDLCGAAADATVPGERVPDRVVDLRP